MTIGIFLGSMTWWLILGLIVVKIKRKLSARWLNMIKYISTLALSMFGGYTIISAALIA